MTDRLWLWIGFGIAVAVMLAIDLLWSRKEHTVSKKEALFWSILWVGVSLVFAAGVHRWLGPTVAMQFLAGYVLEKALSVDNLFVFIMVFQYFRVKPEYQHRILFWGIFGALVMRGIMIAAGTVLIRRFDWILYVFGAFLVWTAWKMATHDENDEIHPDRNPVIRLFRKIWPVTSEDHGKSFFVKQGGRWVATPLFIVILVVETTDLVFATDSIPAIFGVTNDPFVIYTSNVFAILGLRALYFLLAGVMDMFRFLKLGVSIVLGVIGVKMLMKQFWHPPISLSLGIIAGVLAISVAASLLFPKREVPPPEPE